jgi:cob(I)alamin adenosyltransferase
MENHKIYTRTGDKGKTSLIGGTRVPKYHIRIEAYGTVDELNSFIGLVRDHDIDEHTRKILFQIQENLFIIESLLATEDETLLESLPCITDYDIAQLEKEIDEMNQHLPGLHNFILPGGGKAASYAHVARCVCRRAERIIIDLTENATVPVPDKIIVYINRLSDYLFVLARKLANDSGNGDVLWLPRPCH